MQESPVKAKIELKVEALVNPSEHYEKVISAITNVIDKCYPELRYGNRVIARSIGSVPLRTIYEQIRSRSAMGALRRMLIDNRIADTSWFLLNKQAASAGIVVTVEDERESPLGPIKVNIDCEELDTFTDWLVPIKGNK